MSTSPGEYYAEERWNNWLDRLREEEIDPESEDSGRLLMNLQNDAAIAIAKVVSDFEEDELDEDGAMGVLTGIREIVLSEAEFAEEEKLMFVESVQMSLDCVLNTAVHYIVEGPVGDGDVNQYIQNAAAAEAEEDLDAAFRDCVLAGTRIIDGDGLDMNVVEELEYGLVREWVSGLDSLETAMADPEVVEEED
jgi:hypothetical protein